MHTSEGKKSQTVHLRAHLKNLEGDEQNKRRARGKEKMRYSQARERNKRHSNKDLQELTSDPGKGDRTGINVVLTQTDLGGITGSGAKSTTMKQMSRQSQMSQQSQMSGFPSAEENSALLYGSLRARDSTVS